MEKSGVPNRKPLVLGLPKGSLQDMTLDIMKKAGFTVHLSSRSYQPVIDDPEIEPLLVRPQEIPRYVEQGILDCGFSGRDWVLETGAKVREIQAMTYSKVSFRPTRWVLAVPETSRFKKPSDLRGCRIATELVAVTKAYFKRKSVKVKEVEFSYGATEVKPPRFCDAIVEVTETGSSLRANGLRIIDVVFESVPVLVAGAMPMKDPFRAGKIHQIALMFQSVLNASARVGLKMNVSKADLDRVLSLLPALQSPTLSSLSRPGWTAVETVVEERIVRDLFPRLKRAGAMGILEYPLNKILY